MRVKCLAQEHNTMSPARARTRTARSGVERANHEATAPPTTNHIAKNDGAKSQNNRFDFFFNTVCVCVADSFKITATKGKIFYHIFNLL